MEPCVLLKSPVRASAHDRLLDAVAHACGVDGYACLTVERLLDRAGVRRATFYQYFSNADDCFWSAYRRHADELLAHVLAAAPRRRGELAVVDAIAHFAASRPEVASLLMRECLAAGRVGLTERAALMERLELAMAAEPTSSSGIDLPPSILIGATFRFLSMRLTGGASLDRVREDVCWWAESFRKRPGARSWTAAFAPAMPNGAGTAPVPVASIRVPGTARERILRATALTVREKSYRETTVADIVSAAGISRRAFYSEFSSKAAAFIAAYEHGFQQSLATIAPAFFAARTWPERVSHGGQALLRFIAREPHLAYLGFVECYAVGGAFNLRVHDTLLAFTVFFEDGYRERSLPGPLSRESLALTAAAILELCFQASRRDASMMSIRRFQPLGLFVALAPFIGLDQAGEFVAARLPGAPVLACAAG